MLEGKNKARRTYRRRSLPIASTRGFVERHEQAERLCSSILEEPRSAVWCDGRGRGPVGSVACGLQCQLRVCFRKESVKIKPHSEIMWHQQGIAKENIKMQVSLHSKGQKNQDDIPMDSIQ